MTVVGAKSMAGTLSAARRIVVRHAIETDREFVVALAPQWITLSPAPRRNRIKALADYTGLIDRILRVSSSNAALLLAEDALVRPLGLALLLAGDRLAGSERSTCVMQIAVAEQRLASTVGLVLTAASDMWARGRGSCIVTVRDYWLSHPTCVARKSIDLAVRSAAPTATVRRATGCL